MSPQQGKAVAPRESGRRAAPVFAETPELAADCSAIAAELQFCTAVSVSMDPIAAALQQSSGETPIGVAMLDTPDPVALLALSEHGRSLGVRVVVCLLRPRGHEDALPELAADLGIVAVEETRPLIAALALLADGVTRPWTASLRELPPLDRARLSPVCEGQERRQGFLLRDEHRRIRFEKSGAAKSEGHALGDADVVATAIASMRTAVEVPAPPQTPPPKSPEVHDTLFGPARRLSDPASKKTLALFGLPVPDERLCTSASRAAIEAQQLGFPVRVTLASPDLRIWDHPELSEDFVESASAVKEVYRHQVALAQRLEPKSRHLGTVVAVTATTQAQLHAHLSVLETQTSRGVVFLELGFADPHGLASGDRTQTVLPQTAPGLERVISRLAGSPLLLQGTRTERREIVEGLRNLLNAGCGLLQAHEEITEITLEPLALLLGGRWEIREACVAVSDAFERVLAAPATS